MSAQDIKLGLENTMKTTSLDTIKVMAILISIPTREGAERFNRSYSTNRQWVEDWEGEGPIKAPNGEEVLVTTRRAGGDEVTATMGGASAKGRKLISRTMLRKKFRNMVQEILDQIGGGVGWDGMAPIPLSNKMEGDLKSLSEERLARMVLAIQGLRIPPRGSLHSVKQECHQALLKILSMP